MKTVFTILKVDVKSNAHTIVSTHRCRDIAELLRVRYEQNGRGLIKYIVLENSFDPTEMAQATRTEDSIYVDGDYFEEGERLWFDVELNHCEGYWIGESYHSARVPEAVEVGSIKFCGESLDDLSISDQLKRDIEHEAENIKDIEIEKL